MMKLPSGDACPSSSETRDTITNLPMAVAVPLSTIPRNRLTTTNQKKTIHRFSFKALVGSEIIRLSDYIGKVILIVNVASHCTSTAKSYLQLNALAEQFPDLVILGCPCNQFGHQENLIEGEIYTSLKHIRPGKGFVPKFQLTEKVEVNGANAHAVFNFLKISLPYPSDRTLLDEMASPGGVFSHPMRLIWMPVSRADISWNFEKFLIAPDGVPYKRYSPKTSCESLAGDIASLMSTSTPGRLMEETNSNHHEL